VHAMRAHRSRGIALLHYINVSGECHVTASLTLGGGRVEESLLPTE